ncbi:MAG: OmpA family protein [Hyphomonadaceae bacterium]|nr:OmpA family protein [Hyphomonadaceae bacterium]
MKLQLLTAVAATAIMALPSVAFADDAGWYVRGNIGYGASTDIDFTGDLVGDVEGEGNAAGSLGVGYDFGNNWRLELDGAQLWDDLGAISQASNTGADIRYTTAMLNAIYDFDTFGGWEPYVGAGIGIARSKISAEASSFGDLSNPSTPLNNPTCPNYNICGFNSNDNGVAWQLLAGLGYAISDKLTWDTQYRYLNVGELDFGGFGSNLGPGLVGPVGSNAALATADGAGAHMLMTGFRYKFGAKAKPVMYTCWDGSEIDNLANCPAEPPKVEYTTCWDGSQVEVGNACPVQMVTCWDGSEAEDVASCPTRPTVTCWDGSIAYDQASCPVQTRIQSLCAQEYRQDIIYYEFNKGQSAETRQKIQDILDTDQYCAVGSITVVGHTDSSGSAAYNQGLSERRAADVRQELVRQGVNAEIITSQGKGETELFIDTGDGVKEALNRRTEVLIRLNETGVVN